MVDVGISRYGAPGDGAVYGVMQTMADVPGRQVLELKRRFHLQFGYELEVNEGIRSRPRQEKLRAAYLHYVQFGSPWAALAAALYYSTHDASRAGAADLGTRGGEVLTVTEHQFVVDQGAVLGVIWTGQFFSRPEWWHFDVDMSRATQIAPATLTLEQTFPAPEEAEMAQVDIDNAKVAAAISQSLASDGVWIHNVTAEAESVVKARLGKSLTITPTQKRAALRIYALGGNKVKFDAWLQAQPDYKAIVNGTAQKKD
jgi:hypothetical protein